MSRRSIARPVTPTGATVRTCAGFLILALVAACSDDSGGGAPTGGGFKPPPATVEADRVSAGELRDMATFSGQLSARNSVMIRSETDGVVESILFKEGDRVEAGAPLVQLRSAEQKARVREAAANLQLAQERYDRAKTLARNDAVSIARLDETAAELAVARARVELAQVELDRTEIRAPFAGVLGTRLISPGARITDDTPLVSLDSIDNLEVTFAISEIGILFTEVGRPVEVMVGPYPNVRFPGEVFYVSPTLDTATRRIIAKARVPNEDGRLRPGLFAQIDMEVDRRENTILVPEAAVVFDRKGAYVWKLDDDDVAHRTGIAVGLRKNGKVEVLSGLESGARIVTAGVHKVKDGEAVVLEDDAGASGAAATARNSEAEIVQDKSG